MIYQYDQLGGNPEHIVRSDGSNMTYPDHMHREFELIYIKKGEIRVNVESVSEILHENEAAVIFPNQRHSYESVSCDHAMFVFSTQMVQAYWKEVQDMVPVSIKFRPDAYLAQALLSLSEDSSTTCKKWTLYLLMDQYGRQVKYKKKKQQVNEKILIEMISFVERSFTSDCSLRDLSAATGYDYKYLSHVFKRSLGVNFNEHVNNYRLNHACHLLVNTDYSILQCAFESGFKSVRTFNRNFIAKYGVTPAECRKSKGVFKK
ncbi:MAG: helix-turn-helix transcriptional regulator [Clostridia bacterium]|nr:helix-turn-helix transcriptional regulator [Clostridia bacterium]